MTKRDRIARTFKLILSRIFCFFEKTIGVIFSKSEDAKKSERAGDDSDFRLYGSADNCIDRKVFVWLLASFPL